MSCALTNKFNFRFTNFFSFLLRKQIIYLHFSAVINSLLSELQFVTGGRTLNYYRPMNNKP